MPNIVEVNYAQTGNSKSTNALGMREMQEKAFEGRTAQYLLLKAPPASAHIFSTRPFPEKILNFDYESEMRVLKVTKNGSMRWGAYNWVYLSASLQGKYVGALEMGNEIWRVFYRNVFLGYFNENELRTKEKSVRLETNLV